ncbi:peptidase inhibitor family I36 protein [Streptomyces geranii]|uniref:peptidase inhibitor family I36 protein n=1 Tax=Streptomyces geranii TaxID=2058923 RepID=UPI00130055F8|nr:peptidase inhibitor family I36 protein [Streptomyces geranii]
MTVLGFGAPAAQAKASDCKQAQFCFFADSNFEGQKTFWWDNGVPLSTKLDVRSFDVSRTASSVINNTPYYGHIWNASGAHRCLPPGYTFKFVGNDYNDKITHFGLYTDWC